MKRSCFNYQIGLCPGTCIGIISPKEYGKTVKNIVLFFKGKKGKILKNLEKEMNVLSRRLEFEKAEKVKRQIFALQHINDITIISNDLSQISNLKSQKLRRIEGYDISNISGAHPVGVMVVFSAKGRQVGYESEKDEYRKFNIKTVAGQNDVGMIREVIERRFHNEWKHPDLILVDGGLGQVGAVKDVLKKMKIQIPVLGMAKGLERKRTDIIGNMPEWTDIKTLVRVRDEAHRFAVMFHRKKRSAEFIKKR